jgi:hypothetical protein
METEKKELVERLKNLQSLIPDTIKAIEDLPEIEGAELYNFLPPGELRIAFLYNGNYLKIRRLVSKRWQYVGHRFNKYTGHYYVYFHHRTLRVTLDFELEIPTEFQDGLSCRLVEVAHKTEIIYGLECK